ncbi:MAG: hypothetical protein ABIK44_05845 [candidate division WOR-3 bacterium]
MKHVGCQCRKASLWAFALASLISLSCSRFGTVTGFLELRPGTTGRLESVRVELFPSDDSQGLPVQAVSACPTASPSRATFRFDAVPAGTYFLRAWQDVDLDERIGDGDLAGVYGGEYQPETLGQPFRVGAGREIDLGRIEMKIYQELLIAGFGARTQNLTRTDFQYSFNHDIELFSLVVTFPFFGSFIDAQAPGPKRGDTIYYSPGWSLGLETMPAGIHLLDFRGRFLEDTFRILVPVAVQ